MFRSRRPVAPPPETAQVAQVVQAYYDAGKRPASHLAPPPQAVELPVADRAPDEALPVAPEPELVSGPSRAAVAQATPVEHVPQPAPVHKTLADLAHELEAFIEVIRYGDDLGSRAARN